MIKNYWLTALFLGLSLEISSQQMPQEGPLPVHPNSSFVMRLLGYCVSYDARHKNPSWVYEHLSAESLKGDVDRFNFSFKEDESLPEHLRATLADYKGSGYDRGHLAPAGNNKSSPEAMADTFYLSNICPQCPQFNRGYWTKLEKHVRNLTKEYQNIFVITGPLYLPTVEENGKRYVKYEVIGLNDVSVPSHYFKTITTEDWQGRKETRAYILPNAPIEDKTPLENFETTVEKVEKAAGLIFAK